LHAPVHDCCMAPAQGGLGHMGVKFLKSFGVTTTVISTSPNKKQEALEVLGADNFVLSDDVQGMQVLLNWVIDGSRLIRLDCSVPVLPPFAASQHLHTGLQLLHMPVAKPSLACKLCVQNTKAVRHHAHHPHCAFVCNKHLL
jgi:hypothetical protein